MAKLSHWGVCQNFDIQGISQSYVTSRDQNRYKGHKEVFSEMMLPYLKLIPLMDIDLCATALPRESELRSVILGTPFLYSPVGLILKLVKWPSKSL